jgi:hypothetical protein
MSIRLKIEVCQKEGTEHFGSIGATCGLELEIDQSVLADPAAAVARIRGYYAFCETAMNEELARLRTGQPAAVTANGPAAAAAGPNPAAEAPPLKRPVARSPATPPPAKRAAAEPVAEAEDHGDACEPEEDDDPPTDGRRLLGWARNQPEDAKNWLVGLGKRLRYPNRILDWSPKQVQTAYQSYREAHRG